MSTLSLRIKNYLDLDKLSLISISLIVTTLVIVHNSSFSIVYPLGVCLAMAVFVIILKYPKLGLYLLIFNLPLNRYIPLFGLGEESFSISVNEVLMLFLMVSLGLNKLYRGSLTFPYSKLIRPIFLLLLFNAISLAKAFGELPFAEYAKCWLFFFLWAEYFLIIFLILDLIRSDKEIKLIVYLLIFSAMITVVSAIYQQLTGAITIARALITESGKAYYRTASTFGFFSNDYGAYLLVILSILLNLYLSGNKNLKRISLICMLPAFYAFFYTFSRGGLVALVVMLIFLLIIRKNHRKRLLIMSLAFGIIVAVIFAPVFLRWSQQTYLVKGGQFYFKKNISERFAQWDASLDQIRQHPLLGKGFHTYHFRELNYQSEYGMVDYIQHAHNIFLRLLIESGILGLIPFIVLIVIIYKHTFKILKKPVSEELRLLAYITLMALTGFLVGSMMESLFTVGRVTGPMFVLIGLLLVKSRMESINI
ncbi:O-antigen ligase family protein [candidate division KSB1 bacterium]|nr:O-antigen ligase family protein [candidate division KSB1 bacterium]